MRDYGRIDWMPKLKLWSVMWYRGAKDVSKGKFLTYEEASEFLQQAVKKESAIEEYSKCAKLRIANFYGEGV